METGWEDTTVLFVRIFEGGRQPGDDPIATGILKIKHFGQMFNIFLTAFV